MNHVDRNRLLSLVLFVVTVLGARGLLAGALLPTQSETVAPPSIQTQAFEEGEQLGRGVYLKTLTDEELSRPAAVHKVARRKMPAKTELAVKAKAQEKGRSIASIEENSVRTKDSKDYDDTMNLVHAAIERGEYGQAAKEKWEHEKAGK